MKTTKRKLRKQGYSDEVAMKILEMDEKTFYKSAVGSAFERDYLPEKYQLASEGRDVDLFKFIRVYDEIFKLNGLEVNTKDMNFKIDAIKNFPNLLREIELSRMNSEIEALEMEKENALKVLADIENSIKTKKMEFESSKMTVKKVVAEPKVEEPVLEQLKVFERNSEEKTFILGENIFKMRIRGNGNGQFRFKDKSLLEDIEAGDVIKVASEEGIIKYRVKSTSKNVTARVNYINVTYLETVFTNAS